MAHRSRLAWLALVLLAITAVASAQRPERPAIPERRCIRVTLVALPGADGDPRRVGLRIVNADPGDFPARLRAEVEVEQEVGGQWHRVNAAGLQLRATCTGEAPDCVTIEPRSELTIVPWTGMLGDAQCVCTRCGPAPAGRYRFAVRTCQQCLSPIRAVSEPFELPAPPT